MIKKYKIRPHTIRKFGDTVLLSINNTSTVVELNASAYTILSNLLQDDCIICSDDIIIKQVEKVYNLSDIGKDTVISDTRELLSGLLEVGLLYIDA